MVNVLTEPLPASLVRALVLVAFASEVAFLLGWRYRLSELLFALLLL